MAGKHTVKRTPMPDKILLILKYVAANPGGGIDEIIAGTGITFGAVVNTLKIMKDELHVKSERRGFGLRSTYYIGVAPDPAAPTDEQRKKRDGVPRGTRSSAQENRDKIIRYIKRHPGTDKTAMMKGTGLTIHQINSSLMNLRAEVHTTIVGRGGGRTGTYHIKEVPIVKTGKRGVVRLVRAGEIIRRKYGRISPELRKSVLNTIKSAMN